MSPGSARDRCRASYALCAYVAAAVVATWPLARGLGRDVAWDLGDSVLNMWILSWDVEQLRRIAGGDLARIASFFDANIFHPLPLTLAYSEHLLAQAIQIAPLYLLTANPILCYNLLFLSTFALSGLGMYLLVRELTGNTWAAFVAGLIYAFAPYRLAQASHLQVLSSQWMPFVFYGLLRYFETRRVRPLAGAALALVAQNLSSGYYLLFFAPFAAAFGLWQIAMRGLWRDRRVWAHLTAAAIVVAAITAPFLVPYAAVRAQGFVERTLTEVSRFSADVYSYATAFPGQRVWGSSMQAFPKPEGELFPGLVPLILSLLGLCLWGAPRHPSAQARRGPRHEARQASPTGLAPRRDLSRQRFASWLLAALAAGHTIAAIATIAVRRTTIDTGLFVLRIGNINQLLLRAAIAFVLLLVVSPAARQRTSTLMRDRGFFLAALIAAFWLSLGPVPQSMGRPLEIAAPYALLFDYVPGFDGVRVPARFATIVALLLAVLAGYGAAVLTRWKFGRPALALLTLLFLAESTHVPFIVNGATPPRGFNAPEARVYRPARAPAIYHAIAQVSAESVLAELPLGYPDFDQRAMFYSTVHWKPLVNGYSGFTPPHYGRLTAVLSEIPRHADISLATMREMGVTHVLIHEAAYTDGEGAATSALLLRRGAVELRRDDTDVLFQLSR